MTVRVQEEAFDAAAEYAAFRKADNRGATVMFTGTVRQMSENADISAMTLEHYPGMTEKALQDIVGEARARWDISDVLVIHRYGRMLPGEDIVMVLTASAHRKDAYEANEFLMDWLKTKAPFWKLEETDAGGRWVEARETDDAAAARWEK
jgi:molybdopterin synthase catalytic subunit